MILNSIRAGLRVEDAATLSGVNPRSIYRWISLGRKAKRGKFCQFCHAIEEAKIEAKAKHLKVLTDAAGLSTEDGELTPWREVRKYKRSPDGTEELVLTEKIYEPVKAAEFLLKSRYPEEFAPLKIAATATSRKTAEEAPEENALKIEFVDPRPREELDAIINAVPETSGTL